MGGFTRSMMLAACALALGFGVTGSATADDTVPVYQRKEPYLGVPRLGSIQEGMASRQASGQLELPLTLSAASDCPPPRSCTLVNRFKSTIAKNLTTPTVDIDVFSGDVEMTHVYKGKIFRFRGKGNIYKIGAKVGGASGIAALGIEAFNLLSDLRNRVPPGTVTPGAPSIDEMMERKMKKER